MESEGVALEGSFPHIDDDTSLALILLADGPGAVRPWRGFRQKSSRTLQPTKNTEK